MTIFHSGESTQPEVQLPVVTDSEIGGERIQTVNARDLHAFLKVGKMFAHWIRERIQKYGFVEGVDYVVSAETGNNPQGGRPAIEYYISLDMAKELAMVERNEQGKRARRYFIECERRAKQRPVDAMQALNDPIMLRQLLGNYAEKVESLESQVQEMKPVVEAHERIAGTKGSLSIREAAKVLKMQPKALRDLLVELEWIYRLGQNDHWLAYQKKLDDGLLEHKLYTFVSKDGRREATGTQVRITYKGLSRLSKIVNARDDVANDAA